MRARLAAILGLTLLLAAGTAAATESRGLNVKVRDTGGNTVALYKESHALVIGVSDYTNGWPPLRGVREDIPAVRDALEKQGFQVEVVTDPDRDGIDKAFRSFISRHGNAPDNRLLFYFAGHGHSLELGYGGRMGYLVGRDAPNPHTDKRGFKEKALGMQAIENYARNIESKHALFVFDSCFSGSVFDATRAIPDAIQAKTGKPVRQFITSGTADQTVPDQSVFRRQFTAALAGEADLDRDGYVTGAELGQFLETSVTNYTRRAQTPQYGKLRDPVLDKGDFVFALARPSAPEVKVAPPPSAGGAFSLDDLAKQADKLEASKRAWSTRLDEMRKAYGEAEAFERRDVSAELKAAAWERFLSAYGDDNPYSQDDEGLRDKARSRQAVQKQQVASVARVPKPPTPSPTSSSSSRRPGETFRDCTDCPEMVVVSSGSFDMGSNDGDGDEMPVHSVTIPRAFAVGKYEVTFDQWDACVSGGGCGGHKPGDEGWGRGKRPVINVSWSDAQGYVKWLNQKVRRNVRVAGGSGSGPYRLLSESEWEYAARGGTTTKWSCGDSAGCLSDVAVHPLSWPALVGSKSANGFGLHDMHGSVWEWVADCWNGSYAGAPTDGSAWTTGECSQRVQRGGSWLSRPWDLRSANRSSSTPVRYKEYGFRIARTLD